jgi:L-lactate permease
MKEAIRLLVELGLKELELSHWLMIAGAAFVMFGVVGLIVRRGHRSG